MTPDPIIAGCRRPDFFVVGAPKCGTTSLYHYLKQHPEIYLPEVKEPHFFGSDLTWRRRTFARENYPDLYRGAPESQKAGDMSVFHLVSHNAASEIAAACPDARIIAILRDPMSMVPSMHQMALRFGGETQIKFADALALEPDRRSGRYDIAAHNNGVWQQVFYSEIARYGEQLQRYIDVFGRDAVHVVLFEDLSSDTLDVVKGIQKHIGVDPNFEPDIEKHNEAATITNAALWKAVKHPPFWARSLWRKFVPASIRGNALHKASALYSKKGRQGISKSDRATLREIYKNDVAELSRIIDRDLSAWISDKLEENHATHKNSDLRKATTTCRVRL